MEVVDIAFRISIGAGLRSFGHRNHVPEIMKGATAWNMFWNFSIFPNISLV